MRGKSIVTKEELKKRLDERPFQPFKVCLASGNEIEVPSADHAHLHITGRTLFVDLDQGGTEIIDVLLITSLRLMEVA